MINYDPPGPNCSRLTHNNIIRFFPIYTATNFFKVHTTQEHRCMYRENKKIDNKIRLLMERELEKKRQNIKSISCNIPSKYDDSNTIVISPDNFSTADSLDCDKWFQT